MTTFRCVLHYRRATPCASAEDCHEPGLCNGLREQTDKAPPLSPERLARLSVLLRMGDIAAPPPGHRSTRCEGGCDRLVDYPDDLHRGAILVGDRLRVFCSERCLARRRAEYRGCRLLVGVAR